MPKKYDVSFIHTGDIHLGRRQYGLIKREEDFAKSFEWVCEQAIKNKVDFVIIAGDTFDTRTVNAQTLEYAIKPLYKLEKYNIPVFVIDGNHDRKMYKDKIGWLEYLHHEGLIKYIEEYDFIEYKGCNIISLGYNNKINTDEIIYDHENFRIIMLHAGVEGIIPNMTGCISKEEIEKIRPYCDYLALGHVHKQYSIDGWIFNPGSLEHWSISESGWDGGYYLVDVDIKSKKFITKHVISPKRAMFRYQITPTDECMAIYDNTNGAIVEITLVGVTEKKPDIESIKEHFLKREGNEDTFYIKIVDKTKRPSSLNSEHSTKDRTDIEREVIDDLTKDDKITDTVLEIKKRINDDPSELLEVIKNV